MSRYFPTESEYGRHTIFGKLSTRTYAGEHLQFSMVTLPADGIVEWHSHSNEQMGMVVTGRVAFFIGDEEKILGPGDMYLAPGGVRHKVVPLDGPATVLDAFHPVRDEYR